MSYKYNDFYLIILMNYFGEFKELFVILYQNLHNMRVDITDALFSCDTCNKSFGIDSGGFLGEHNDLSKFLKNGNTNDNEVGFSCSPFTELKSLCNSCLNDLKDAYNNK